MTTCVPVGSYSELTSLGHRIVARRHPLFAMKLDDTTPGSNIKWNLQVLSDSTIGPTVFADP